MTAELYRLNRPEAFWRLIGDSQATESEWETSTLTAAAGLPEGARGADTDSILDKTLGEGQFGPGHWDLSLARKMYYRLKPVLPRPLTRRLRQVQGSGAATASPLGWPIEPRYAQFMWGVVGTLLATTNRSAVPFIHFWPDGHRFAFVLTHDVETADGQAHVQRLADLETEYGFRSSFNFVAERYRLDHALLDSLKARGFEIGVHGLKHDGRLFSSHPEFVRRAARINQHLKALDAVGFRAPLTHRQPEWMQALEIEYDLSFFDTDPYEPIPGGTMTIWPFQIGRFIELPYTLVQDYTLTAVLGETTPRIWVEKVDFIETFSGLALLNSHPDYLLEPANWRLYEQFLQAMRRREGSYWHALPREVARWWRARRQVATPDALPGAVTGTISLNSGDGEARISIRQLR
jgi:peptidoglycan/xylan/chitin deacetylase (PgdA/CDA1 family)